MIHKLGLLITFFTSVTTCVAESESQSDEPFSVEKVWQQTASSSETKPTWIGPAQKYYDDCIEAFSSFPEQVKEPAGVVKATFQTIITKFIESSNSESDILSVGATRILESFMPIDLYDHSAQGIIDEFTRMLPILMDACRIVVEDLMDIIGSKLVDAVNDDIRDLEFEFDNYVWEFEMGDGKEEVSYEPVMKRVQKLSDTISLKGDVKLSESQLEDQDVQDALVVLSLVYDYDMVLVHGLSSSSEAVLCEQQSDDPTVLHDVVMAMGDFVSEITDSMVVNTVPDAVNVTSHFKNICDCYSKLNATLTPVFQSG